MITVGMNYEVLEGKEKAFESKCSSVIDLINKAPGHSKTDLFRNVKNGSSYLIVSEWNNHQAFDEFIASDEFCAVTDWGKEHILSARPQHKIYGDPPSPEYASGGSPSPVG